MFLLLKRPKVLSILLLFIILFVSQARWEYVGSNFSNNEFVRYKIDRFTDFKYVEVFSSTGSGDRPAYNEFSQYSIYKTAENIENIEETIIRILLIFDIIWIIIVWCILPFIYFVKNKILKINLDSKTIPPD
ncbi:hypothetical protein Thena_0950 [Thermodesulfobium narugense DSM 14796]|uniref:Uncharacterized protein n=1 Tax=Thermodesulfobium narugense DSM 14796 TaxID=747365 RepID=M1E8N4_9BACT|nr:hypothetical protein [Thermodesulfobium narugense]AEE14579.1 hypothetical protein Thena_0950 [Thermodesulfobium narugense DSM 14796]